jgi:hypothetical protein
MRSLILAAMLLLGARAGLAADPGGKWKGEAVGGDGVTRTFAFDFKADGDKLTGAMTREQGESPIAEGRIKGDTISFSVTINVNGDPVKILYTGKVAGNEIHFEMQRDDGEWKNQFTAKRQ